jgi:hypothetical protein
LRLTARGREGRDRTNREPGSSRYQWDSHQYLLVTNIRYASSRRKNVTARVQESSAAALL